jgi:hypothetical protein
MPIEIRQDRQLYVRYEGNQIAEFKGGNLDAVIVCLGEPTLENLAMLIKHVDMFARSYGEPTVVTEGETVRAHWHKDVPPPSGDGWELHHPSTPQGA